jgi:hypothetical protein
MEIFTDYGMTHSILQIYILMMISGLFSVI